MKFDLMTGATTWAEAASLAKDLERVGFSGMLWTETSQVPWMQIAAAATAAPTLTFTTGIAVAFPRSPMVTAQIAWELAQNTGGRFRLGLGSQVKGHIVRRYATEYSRPAARMRDYIEAVEACFRAFRGEEKLSHDGEFYKLSMLPPQWAPPRHDHGDIKIDISAVGPYMTKVAGAVADGVHVHPWHSMPYIENRLLPDLTAAAEAAGRQVSDIDLIIPVFMVPGDTPEERAAMAHTAKTQIAFYASTPNYAFQFEDLGYEGMTAKVGERLKAGDVEGMAALITDEMLDHYALVAPWDEMADKLVGRYGSTAARVVTYLGQNEMQRDPNTLDRWGEIATAVTAA